MTTVTYNLTKLFQMKLKTIKLLEPADWRKQTNKLFGQSNNSQKPQSIPYDDSFSCSSMGFYLALGIKL